MGNRRRPQGDTRRRAHGCTHRTHGVDFETRDVAHRAVEERVLEDALHLGEGHVLALLQLDLPSLAGDSRGAPSA